MAKKRQGKERLPYHIVKDSQNQLRLKMRELTKRYRKIPKRIFSSGIIVLGILLIVLVAVLFGGNQNTPEISNLSVESERAGLLDVIIDENNQLTVNLPPANGIELQGLESWELEEKTANSLDQPAEMAVNLIDHPEDQNFQIIYPLRRQGGVITEYGWYFHPILEKWSYHPGVDIRCQKGEIVMAAAAGTVEDIKETFHEITLITLNHGEHWTTIYGQVDKLAVKVGDQVVKGQKLGIIGQSTTAIEPHLHFEIRQREETVDPQRFF